MAIQYSTDVRDARNNAATATIGAAPVLEIWAGTKPADCATADTGTKIAQGTLPSTWMGASSSGAMSKSGTWTVTGLPAAGSGTVGTYFRITVGGVCKEQGSFTVTGGGGDMTADNANIANNQAVTVNSHTITDANG